MLHSDVNELIRHVKAAKYPYIEAGWARLAAEAALASGATEPCLPTGMRASLDASPRDCVTYRVVANNETRAFPADLTMVATKVEKVKAWLLGVCSCELAPRTDGIQ